MSFAYQVVHLHINEAIDPAATFVYIMWPWRHFRRHLAMLTTDGSPTEPRLFSRDMFVEVMTIWEIVLYFFPFWNN